MIDATVILSWVDDDVGKINWRGLCYGSNNHILDGRIKWVDR